VNTEREFHYFHTVMDFMNLLRKGDISEVVKDMRAFDLTTYESLVKIIENQNQEKTKKIAALFRDPNVCQD
jgi:muramidase (phage lysozyme)